MRQKYKMLKKNSKQKMETIEIGNKTFKMKSTG